MDRLGHLGGPGYRSCARAVRAKSPCPASTSSASHQACLTRCEGQDVPSQQIGHSGIVRLAIVLVLFALLALVFVVIGRGLMQSGALRSPEDDWAPVEAVFGRKFLARTARSRRRWVRDPAGTAHLIEATKHDLGYRLKVDGEQVGFTLPADLNGAMGALEHKVRRGGCAGVTPRSAGRPMELSAEAAGGRRAPRKCRFASPRV